MNCLVLLCFLFGLSYSCEVDEKFLKVGSFNIKIFGPKKLSNQSLVINLARIAKRYDLIIVLEIRDVNQNVGPTFLDAINNQTEMDENIKPYKMKISGRLGRSNQKEQFAFFYRSNRLEVVNMYQFPDDKDFFERPPFTVLFKCPSCSLQQFAVMANHLDPDDVPAELGNLTFVYDAAVAQLQEANFLILGDMNADCAYLSNTKRKGLHIFNNQTFHSLISNDADTTTKQTTDCAYDRIFTAGPDMFNAIVPQSSGVFNYQTAFGLTDAFAWALSDHFLVETSIKGIRKVGSARAFSGHDNFNEIPPTAAATSFGGRLVASSFWLFIVVLHSVF